MTDEELLDLFVQNRSEDAFRTLLERHLALVYAAALRQVRDPGMAQDVAQAVFVILARKSAAVRKKGTPLPAWLLVVTRYASVNALQRLKVRVHHEREAVAMKTQSASTVDSEILSSIIDEALNRLAPPDRAAIALYYLENRSLREIGDILVVSEDAAQKRVSRALDRLKLILARRGIVSPADALEASLHQYGAIAVPPMLLASILSGVLGHSAVSGAGSLIARQVLKKMLLAKVKVAVLSAAIAGVVAAPTVPLVYHALSGPSVAITSPLPNPASGPVLSAVAPIPTGYTVIDLTPAGLPMAIASGIWHNQQVGGAGTVHEHAMLWLGTAASAVDLNPNGFTSSTAYATYGVKQVGYGIDQTDSQHALEWNGSSTKYVDLNPYGFDSSKIYDISGNQEVGIGQIANSLGGGVTNVNPVLATPAMTVHALLWIDDTNNIHGPGDEGFVEEMHLNVNGVPVDKAIIDLNPKGFTESVARATDGFKQVGSGYGVATGGQEHALLWSSTAASAIDLNPNGFVSSQAYGIGGLQIVGHGTTLNNTGTLTGLEPLHALLWTGGSAASAVDLSPSGFFSSLAAATNGRQQVGFGNATNDYSEHALLWNSSAKNFVDLNQFLPTGFHNADANSINAQGDIVGMAMDSSNKWHAIEWVPNVIHTPVNPSRNALSPNIFQRILSLNSLHVKGLLYTPDGTHPIELFAQQPDFCRVNGHYDDSGPNGPQTTDVIITAEHVLTLDAASKTETIEPENRIDAEYQIAEVLQNFVQMLFGADQNYTKLRSETLSGVQTNVYQGLIAQQARIEVWVNPATGLPVKAVLYQTSHNQPDQPLGEFDTIEPNPSISAAVFDPKIPSDYTIIQTKPIDATNGGGLYGSSGSSFGNMQIGVRYSIALNNGDVLLCWYLYDDRNHAENFMSHYVNNMLTINSMTGMAYRQYLLHADAAPQGYHWRWSLLRPANPTENPAAIISILAKDASGDSNEETIQPIIFLPKDLPELVQKLQLLTLPAGYAPMSLSQIETLSQMKTLQSTAP
jgi:RNA polymerase sigma factor (sigma-70 family)